MNRIYRSIWNKALNVWMAVSEIAKGAGKRSSNRRQLISCHSNRDTEIRVAIPCCNGKFSLKCELLAMSLLVYTSSIYALPTGNQLVAGQATVSTPNANTMQIQQGSQNTVINWQGFSVGQNQAVNIQQPNSQAALLNRVVGVDASQIQGQINANGQVYLINPNGVLFSKTAQVDVAGLVATTHDISNANFMAGTNHFTQNGATGTVQNDGTINAKSGGVVALIGTSVTNNGTINTPNGTTALAAGKTVDLDFQGNGLVEVKVSAAALNAQVTNKGAIVADGGRVLMTAQTAGQLIDTVINQQGIVRAQSMSSRNGDIILDGGNNGTVQVSGTLNTNATTTASNATGGNVKVTGAQVQINNGALVTASGNAGGGVVTLGDKQNTQQTTIKNGAVVSAQALTNGTAGTINVFANMDKGTLKVAGKLDASAPKNGNGGFIETSAANVKVANTATISTTAANGNTGTWLIDPNDFTIAASGGSITGAALASNLATNNVTISTHQSKTAGTGNININDTINYNSLNNLILSAINNVNVNKAISNTGLGTLNLHADSAAACIAGAASCSTINFSGTGSINAAGTVNLYYNPTGINAKADVNGVGASYATPTNYTSFVTAGTLNAYMLVNDVNQLQAMNTNLSGNYALGTNINANATNSWNAGAGFVPVGGYSGNFDGLGHTITGLMINAPSTTTSVGLFGSNSGNISNVGLVGGSVTGSGSVGELVGGNRGTINNTYATGNVTGAGYIGGLLGSQFGHRGAGAVTDNSYATGNVTGTGTNDSIGGLVGYVNSYSGIGNSYATGNVSGNGSIGGLLGRSTSSIAYIDGVYATGNVTGNGSIGGLVGYDNSGIGNAYATGKVTGTGTNDFIGGLVGYVNGSISTFDPPVRGSISNAYATGNVTGSGNNEHIGGLIGDNEVGNISNAYSTGNVRGTGSSDSIGGLVGYNYSYPNSYLGIATISNVYATGRVVGTGSNDYLGGLMGYNNDNINNAYATSRVTGTGSSDSIGGLVGYNNGTINIAHATGNVTGSGAYDINTGTGSDNIGGLVGYNNGSIINAYATGWVTNTGAGTYNSIGGLVGRNDSIINNAYATGRVTGTGTNDSIGGLVGANGNNNPANTSIITNAYATGNVTGNGFIGGLVGITNYSVINNVYATGNIRSTGSYIGGLIGEDYRTSVSNAYATGRVTGSGFIGGLLGYDYEGAINNAYATGRVTGTGDCIGGLVGYSYISGISNAYATGKVTGTGYNVGGLVGLNLWGSISNAYATGNVTGTGNIGGLVGYNYGSISDSYATGRVTGTHNYIGGLVGYNEGTISNSFWNTQTTHQKTGVGGGSSSGATGETTAQMMQLSTFSNAGWSIADTGGSSAVWRIYDGYTAPLLRSFLTPLTITSDAITKTYNGHIVHALSNPTYSVPNATSSGNLFNINNPYGSATHVGTYTATGLYSNQQGYDISLVNTVLTIQPHH